MKLRTILALALPMLIATAGCTPQPRPGGDGGSGTVLSSAQPSRSGSMENAYARPWIHRPAPK
jgi:hypothetical protein